MCNGGGAAARPLIGCCPRGPTRNTPTLARPSLPSLPPPRLSSPITPTTAHAATTPPPPKSSVREHPRTQKKRKKCLLQGVPRSLAQLPPAAPAPPSTPLPRPTTPRHRVCHRGCCCCGLADDMVLTAKARPPLVFSYCPQCPSQSVQSPPC